MYFLLHYKKLSGTHHIVDKSGQVIGREDLWRSEPKQPRIEKTLVEIFSGELKTFTDVEQTIRIRNNKMKNFLDLYSPLFANKEISILEFVFKEHNDVSISSTISNLKKKLTRKNIEIYSSLWIRDVGHINYENHVHWLVITSRLKGDTFNDLFSAKRGSGYEVEFCRNLHGRIKYFSEKPLYGKYKQPTYHISGLLLPKSKHNK